MKFTDKVSMGYRDLTNRKGRSILTILAVSIGALLLIILLGVGDGIISKMHEMVESFGDINAVFVYPVDAEKEGDAITVSMGGAEEIKLEEVEGDEASESKNKDNKYENFKKITDDDIKPISEIDGVKKMIVCIQGAATSYKVEGKDYIDRQIQVVGENNNYNEGDGDSLVCGKEMSGKDDILICENLIKKLGYDNNEDIVGKKLTVKIEMPAMQGMEAVKAPLEVTGTVCGVLDRTEFMNCIIMDQYKAQPLVGYYENKEDTYIQDNGYSGLKVIAEDGVNGTDLAKKIQSETGYTCISMSMISDIYTVMGNVVKSILSIGGVIVLVVAGLGLINTITMIIQEKRKMIGVMRSVGGSRSNIRSVFLWQSIIIGVAGCVLGAVLSTLAILFINEFITKSSEFVISISGYNMGIALIITFIISLIAGLVPAGRAAKLNVVMAVAEE